MISVLFLDCECRRPRPSFNDSRGYEEDALPLIVEVRQLDGTVLRTQTVSTISGYNLRDNARDMGIVDPIDLALLAAAPECCPWDCDCCNGEFRD